MGSYGAHTRGLVLVLFAWALLLVSLHWLSPTLAGFPQMSKEAGKKKSSTDLYQQSEYPQLSAWVFFRYKLDLPT